jgi:archaeal flagellar protein FlaJ
MFRYLSKLFPGRVRKSYKNLLRYCDIDVDHEKFVGILVFIGLVVAAVVSINLVLIFSFVPINWFAIVFVLSYLLSHVIAYTMLVLKADGKGRFVENILPDALLLMAMNIKSGMTTDRALILAARPEFGPLEKELNRAGKQVLAGKPIKYALTEIPYRIRSNTLDRTMRLIIEGIESGGELSNLLQQTSEEIQSTKIVQNEVKANILMYAIFIFFAVAVGAPLLFGVSTYLVGNIGHQSMVWQSVGGGSDTPTFQISADFLVMFAVLALGITSFFGGLIIGIVKNGDEKSGLKTVPILALISLAVFFIVRIMVSSMLPSFS